MEKGEQGKKGGGKDVEGLIGAAKQQQMQEAQKAAARLSAVDGDAGVWELIQEMSFWRGVAAKLHISLQQKKELLEAYHLYSDVLKQVTAEQTRCLTKLLECLKKVMGAPPAGGGGVGEGGLRAATLRSLSPLPEDVSEVEERIREYLVVSQRCHIPHIMLSFLVLNLLTPWQRCLAIVHCYPSFLNLKLLLAAICEEELKQESGVLGGGLPPILST